MASIDRPPAKGNLGSFALRPEQPPTDPAASGHLQPRSLADVQHDARYSDRAKRLAAYLDGCCWGDDKWVAWPKVSTIAAALGWGGDPVAFRKRVERAMAELFGGGALRRMTLRELVEWHRSEGAALGLAWPAKLPRGIRLSLKVCVLDWRIPVARTNPPILPRCDISVAPNEPTPEPEPSADVASHATETSHEVTTEMSHSLLCKALSSNVPSESTYDGSGLTTEGEGEPMPPAEPVATVEAPPPVAVADLPPAAASDPRSPRRIAAYRLIGAMIIRGILFRLEPDGRLGFAFQNPTVEPPTPEEAAQVRELMPEVLEELRWKRIIPQPSTTAIPLACEGNGPPAPKVRRDDQADVKARIGRLTQPETTRPDVLATAKALASALGPHLDPAATERTFLLWCGQARSGLAGMSQGILIDAFEMACEHRSALKRGAVFVRMVKKLQGGTKPPGTSPG